MNWDKPVVVVPGKANTIPAGKVATLMFAPRDGDEAKLRLGDGSKLDCRISGYDAPETDKTWAGKRGAQPHAVESLNELKRQLSAGEVRVTVSAGPSERNFGRSMCKIEVAGKSLSHSMLEAGAGMLWKYGADANRNAQDIAAAESAKVNKRGIHSYPTPPIDPVTWKHTAPGIKL